MNSAMKTPKKSLSSFLLPCNQENEKLFQSLTTNESQDRNPNPINSIDTHEAQHRFSAQVHVMYEGDANTERIYKQILLTINQQIESLVQAKKLTTMVVANKTNRCT